MGFSLPLALPQARCAFTTPFRPYQQSQEDPAIRLAVYFLWHFPWGRPRRALPGILSCGARTFLCLDDSDHPTCSDLFFTAHACFCLWYKIEQTVKCCWCGKRI